MACRDQTNDLSVVHSIFDHDEYGIPDGLTGHALDVGAHIGAWTVATALDNPEMRFTAIEALPANVEVLRANLAENGLSDRVEVIWGAAGLGTKATTIRYAFTGPGDSETHRYIGNQRMAEGTGFEVIEVPTYGLGRLVGKGARLVKIDCEGCEFSLLTGTALRRVDEIVGEYHDAGIVRLLDKTHVVTTTGTETFGAFRAVRR
jgi:FkbM family methyltransferase